MLSSPMHPCGSVSNSELEYYVSPHFVYYCNMLLLRRQETRSNFSKELFFDDKKPETVQTHSSFGLSLTQWAHKNFETLGPRCTSWLPQ